MRIAEVQEVLNFLWERNPSWQYIITKENMFKYLIKERDTVYVCRNATKDNKEIDGVALYQKYDKTINFVGLTARNGAVAKALRRSLKDIIKKEKAEQVCWMNAKFKFRIFKVNKGEG